MNSPRGVTTLHDTASSPIAADSPRVGNRPAVANASNLRRPSEELLVDESALAELESHARAISSNIDMALRDLRGSLRGMADLTVESSQLFNQSINSTCDQMDAAVKATYSMLAKTEELTESMKGVARLAQQAKDMRTLVEQLETMVQASSTHYTGQSSAPGGTPR